MNKLEKLGYIKDTMDSISNYHVYKNKEDLRISINFGTKSFLKSDDFRIWGMEYEEILACLELIENHNLSMEYFKSEFEKLGYTLSFREENDKSIVEVSFQYDCIHLCYIKKDYLEDLEVGRFENSLMDLITKFQKWYWRDK